MSIDSNSSRFESIPFFISTEETILLGASEFLTVWFSLEEVEKTAAKVMTERITTSTIELIGEAFILLKAQILE
jgi:hypothetical protein